MRGRKKKDSTMNKTISVRVPDKEHEIYKKNAWIRDEIAKNIREYLKVYVVD